MEESTAGKMVSFKKRMEVYRFKEDGFFNLFFSRLPLQNVNNGNVIIMQEETLLNEALESAKSVVESGSRHVALWWENSSDGVEFHIRQEPDNYQMSELGMRMHELFTQNPKCNLNVEEKEIALIHIYRRSAWDGGIYIKVELNEDK